MDLLFAIDDFSMALFVLIVFLFAFFGLDDLFIDLYYRVRKLAPLQISPKKLRDLCTWKEKNIAIMVACWHEDDVLQRMISGNISRIQYAHYHFFLGVYPNDAATMAVANDLKHRYSNVHMVVNASSGPTSKGQMINQIAQAIFSFEKQVADPFHIIMFHDSEDMIHPLSLKVINYYMDQKDEEYDFIQIPIFSMPARKRELVSGVYMEEFAESHLKDLLVRADLKLPIPSAGVGTAMSRRLVQTYMQAQDGNLLNPLALTEDYELGVSALRHHMKSTFLLCMYENEYIATKEYFPKKFWHSVRQKSRWTLGIVFQGTKNLGWSDSFKENYFLYRDRKTILTTPLSLLGMVLFVFFLIRVLGDHTFFAKTVTYTNDFSEVLAILLVVNLGYMCNRIYQRTLFTYKIYGTSHALLVTPRIVVGNIINALAVFQASKQFVQSLVTGKAPKWIKTKHELPADFGVK
ncbi:MAG: phage adsorption protein NrfB [Oligoflexia bacterium]|nr:phage adsorption protein NrfB [Oligoflexia bacterium]